MWICTRTEQALTINKVPFTTLTKFPILVLLLIKTFGHLHCPKPPSLYLLVNEAPNPTPKLAGPIASPVWSTISSNPFLPVKPIRI
jgi:hypothetical protein